MLVRNLITNRTICLGSLTRAVASLANTVNSYISLASLARTVFIPRREDAEADPERVHKSELI